MRLISVCVMVLLLAVPSLAQTSSAKATWDQPLAGAQTFADLATFQWTQKIGTAPATAFTPTCVNGTPIKCSTPVPYPLGAATLTITASNFVGAGTGTLSGSAPANPVNITITVTVSVP